MKVNYPYLKDEKFLVLADTQRLQTQHIKLTLLDWDENPIQEIQGIATGGTISLNGSSAIRRTCSLNMTVDEIAETAITSVKNLISINKKLFLEIGIENKTRKYPEYSILWYPQGTFVFTSCNLSSGIGQGYTLSAQLKDKMCLLNGECGGTFTSSVELDRYDTLDSSTGEIYTTKNTISQIIRELVNHFGKIPLDKIIINDIDEKIKMTMRWSGDMPLYLAQKDSSYMYTTSYADAVAYGGNIKMFQYGEDCGFTITDFVYPSELIANIGDNICTILDKIKNALGNYEYYFDIDGNFIFQEIKNYLNTTQATVDLQNMSNNDYKIDIAKGKSIYDFTGAELITSYSNNPNYNNIKNDYVVWGIRENASKVKIPIRYHLAIDDKPQTGNIYRVYMYYDTEDGLLKARMPIGFDDKSHFPTIGNEDLLYWDKSTGFVYKWDVDKQMYVSPDGKQYSVYSDTDPGNNDTIYVDSTELQMGSGTNAKLTNTAANRKLSFKKYYGNTTQTGTPTPTSPIPINNVTGDNVVSVVNGNGNLIDINSLKVNNISVEDGVITGTANELHYCFRNNNRMIPNTNFGNKQVAISISAYTNGAQSTSGQGLYLFVYYTDGSSSNILFPNNTLTKTTKTLVTNANKSIARLCFTYSSQPSNTWYISDFIVVEGSTPSQTNKEYVGNTYEVNLGKNLLDLTRVNFSLCSLNDDGTITSNISNNYFSSLNFTYLNDYIMENKGNTLTFSIDSGIENRSISIVIQGTRENGTTYQEQNYPLGSREVSIQIADDFTSVSRVELRWNRSSSRFTDTTTTISNLQLEKFIYATSYSPYKTPIELNKINTYQDTIFKSSGINLVPTNIFDKPWGLSGSGDNRTITTYSSYKNRALVVQVEPNTTYTVSGDFSPMNSNTIRIPMFDSEPEVNSISTKYVYGTSPYTFTTDTNTHYIVLWNSDNIDTTINLLMLLKGTYTSQNLPSYEPYGKDWYIKKEIGKMVLDGSESWNLQNVTSGKNFYTKLDNSLSNSTTFLNNMGVYRTFGTTTSDVPEGSCFISSSRYLNFLDNRYSNTTDFKTALGTNNMILYIPYVTPTYTIITDNELVEQLEALYNNGYTYDEITNILQSNSELPLTMDYTYYTKKEDSSSSQRYTWEVDPSSEHYEEIMEQIDDANETYEEETADEKAVIESLQEQIQEYNDALAALDITYKTELTREKSLQRQIANLQSQTQTAAIAAKILELQTELAALQAGDLAPYYTSKNELESAISTAEASIATNQAAINAAAATRDATISSLMSWLGEYKLYTDNSFVPIQTTDWRSELYLSGVAAEALGLDQNYYYAELAAEWPKLYNFFAKSYIDSETGETIYTGDFTDEVKNNPWSVDYWLDFIDSESAIGGLSVDNIGRRSITKSSDDYNCMFESEIPDLVLIKEDTETTDAEREACEKRGQDYCQVEASIYDLLVSGGWANSCFNEIKNLLWFNTSYNSSINLSLIPIYHLEPNTRITVQSVENDIHGDYMMNSLSIPLTYNSTMSISGTQVQTKL